MSLSKKTNNSKIKILLEWITLFICLILLLVLCLPFFSSQLLNFALQNKGIDFVKCPITQTTSLKLLSPQCIFSFPLAVGRAEVTANDLEIAYKDNALLPILNLASLTIKLPNSFKVDSNKKSSTTDFSFPLSELHLKKGSLYIGKNPIAKFSADLFDLSESMHGLANIDIESIYTNTEIPLKKIQFKLIINKITKETSNLAMEAVTANILGGQISSKHIDLENYKPQPFIVDLEAVDLSLLLGLSGKSIIGTGKISGELPVAFTNEKLSIKNGFLQSLAPGGELHYTPSAEALETAKQNQDTNFTLKALEQFYYDQMVIKLQYDNKGNLLANIFLEGKNPKISNGRKIQFNINVEENILSLLKSLSLVTQVKKEDWIN